MKLVSIVIPVYNKEQIIVNCVKKINRQTKIICEKLSLNYELIAVLDGCSDNTKENLKSVSIKNLKVISYEINRGKGFAVRYGKMNAKGDYVGFVDSGIDLDYSSIKYAITQIVKNKAHIVVGSKKHKKSVLVYPTVRKVYTKVYSILSFLLTGINYADSQVGLKIFSREAVDLFLPRILVKRYAFDVEILAVLASLGFDKHIDIPVRINFGNEISTAATFKEISRMVWDTIAVSYRLRILDFYKDKNKAKWSEALYDLFVT
jgi:glycosyltransferase involved in cell wall biosynthesis